MTFDIGAPSPFTTPPAEGLLALLAERPYASLGRIPDEDRPKPTPAPKPAPAPVKSAPPKPKPVTPPAKPTPARATPTKSTDQAKKGASNNRPAKSPPAAPVVRPTPKPVTKSSPARPKPGASRPAKGGSSTPAKGGASRPVKGGGGKPSSSTPTKTRPGKPSGAAPTSSKSKSYGAPTKTGATKPTPSKAGTYGPTKTGASKPRPSKAGTYGPTKTGATTPTPSKAGTYGPTKTSPTPATKAGATRPSKMAASYGSTTTPVHAKPRPASPSDAAVIDARLTPAQRQQAIADQAALERAEQQARDRNKPAPVPAGTNRAIRDEINASNSTTRSTATAEVRELRQDYFETHDTWIDANGTAYNANYNATTGAIELARDEKPTPADPAKNIPATRTSRRVTIATDRSREDIGITATVPTGRVGETNQVRTERVATDPAGNKTDSSIRLEQERRNADGSTERSVNEEQYNAQNKATSRHQEQSTTKANGDVTSSSTDTNFAPDGTTPTQTVSRSHSQTGSGDSQRVDDRATTTYYLADGVTPRHQQVVESGTDKPTTTAITDFDAQGEPTDTFIRRDGGDLPEGVTRTEYVTWGPNGDVARRLNGGEGVSEYEFEPFAKTGAGPTVMPFDEWNRQHGGSFLANAGEYALYVSQQKLEEGDPNAIPGGEDPVKWVRGDDDRFTAENLNGNLVEPLTPATSTPSVFDVPAQLTARANAEAIDNSPYAPGGPRFEELNTDQRSYEQRIAGASTDAQREAIMSEYFGTHDYWIDRGTKPGDAPVLMASGWSEGAPSSTMFGASRAADPHATLARTGMEGTDDLGQPATLDLVTNLYTDGTRDDITRSTYDGPAGASRVRVSGEHTNAAGVVTEHDVNSQSRVSRTAQGLEPLAVTEVSRERFNEVTGKPQGEQYFGVASSDSRTTTLEERKDYYTTDGVIYDTKIDATSMSRNYDADLTRDFLATNQDVIDQARSDDFSPNSDGETVTTPPVGSNYSTTHTDIDYSSTGVAVYQKTDESSTSVEDADDDNHNGVRVIETNTTKESGTQGGTAPIFDDAGKLIVDVKLVSTVKSTEFDPDAGVAGGNKSAGHQFREITSVTVGSTTHPDGSKADQWATPFKTQTLREGFDDDWQFVEKNLKTQSTGELVIEGEGDEAHPVELGDDTEIYNSRGERVNLDDAKIEHEDLDFADKFEEFMEGWGGKIIGVAGVVVGVALIATGVGSPLGVALAAGGVALASTQLAYTAINYSQGEASGLDLAIAGAGVALSVVPAITGVRQLAAAGRGARALSAARAAGAADDVARGIADDVIRAGQGGRGAQVVNSTANVGGTGLDAKDGYDATRAALQGDFYGAALMLTAIGAGAGVSRVRGPHVNAGGPTGTPDAPDINSNPTPDLPSGASGAPHGQPGAPGLPSPSTSSGAPSVRPNGTGPAPIGAPRPLPGTNTGAGNSGTNGGGNGNGGGPAAPASTNTGTPSSVDAPSAVGGARGDGVGGPDNASTGAGTDRRPPYEQFNQDAIRGGREVANRGSALDPAVASVRPNTEDGILFSHVANGHAVDPSIAPTAQGFPRRPAASPEVLGFAAGDLPPVGTIVRAPDGYHMVTDANGTTTPVTAKGHPREGSPSDLTTLGATDKWQVPKSQFSPELAGSLRGENTQLQEMVDQAILDPNNTRIDSQPTPDTYVMRFDTGRPTGTQNGADVNGIVISWRRGQDGTWLPESISPERVDSSPAAGRSTAADAAPIAQPHPGHHDDAAGIFGQGLPSTDAPGPNARRVIGPDGNPAIVFGRLPDGRLILGDGQGNRQAVDPALVVDGNRTDFAQDILPSGSRVNVRRTDGTFEQDWVVSAHNADGTVTVTRADGQLEKTIRSSDLFQQNAHRALGPDTVARTIHSNGTTSDGWIPTNTIGDEVVLVRPNERGQVEVRRMPASDFMALNSDRVLGANGSYPGTTPLRRGLGGDHDVPDLSVVEGRDFQRSGPGNIPEAGDYLFRGGIDVQHGNIRIRVETDPGTPSLVVRQRVEALQAAIDAMPPEMRANIRRVNVLEGRNPQDSYWAQQTGDANFRSGATAGGDTVNMFYGTEGDVTSLFAHEATHTFGLDGGPFHRNEWENAMAADAAHLSGLRGRDRIRTLPYGMQLDSPAISGYAQLQYDGALNAQGQRNVNEDWAETGGFTVQGERNGGIVATRRRWLGLSTQNYTMADLFPNRSAMFDQYRANIRQFGSPYGPPAGYHTPPQGFGPGAGAPGIAAGTPNGSVTGSSVFTMLTQPGFTAGLHTGAQSAEDDEARG